MNQQITYRPGHPQTFVCTRTFDIGNTNLKAIEGQTIDFDGTLLTMPGHPPIAMPTLRGAIRLRWIVPVDEYNPNDISMKVPQPAGVQVRPAEGGNPLDPKPRQTIDTSNIDHEEREVANVSQHAAGVQQRNQNREYRTGAENKAMPAGTFAIEVQDGVPVRGLQTPARQDTDVTRAGEAISKAKAVQIQGGQAPTREDVMASMSPELRAQYLQELAANKASHDLGAAARMMDEASQVVGRVAAPGTQHKEGFKVAGSVGGGTEIADLGGTGVAGPAQTQVVEEGGIKFTQTNGPKKGVRLVDKPAAAAGNGASGADDALCRQIATAVCPDFPTNYVFTDPIRKKIARLQADYDDRPDVIRAVAAAETDSEMKRRVVEEFPSAF